MVDRILPPTRAFVAGGESLVGTPDYEIRARDANGAIAVEVRFAGGGDPGLVIGKIPQRIMVYPPGPWETLRHITYRVKVERAVAKLTAWADQRIADRNEWHRISRDALGK